MPQFGAWRPIQDTHAIQLASVSLTLNEPAGDLTRRRAHEAVEEAASRLGLTERSVIGFQLPAEIQIIGVPVQPPQGTLFSRRERPDVISERLQITPESIRYEDYSYVRWVPFKARARDLMARAAEAYTASSSVNNITSEYVDVFQAVLGEGSVADVIRSDSKWVAPGVFRPEEMWHCHTGWFEPINEQARRLIHVNIEVADNVFEEKMHRQVRIRTRTYDQFGREGAPLDEPLSWQRVEEHFDSSHQRLKSLLSEIVTEEAATAISLG